MSDLYSGRFVCRRDDIGLYPRIFAGVADVDLIVFVMTATAVRLEKLAAGEKARFGDRTAPGGDMHDVHVVFCEWASQYDNPDFPERNRARHEAWIAEQTAQVLRVDGASIVEDMAAQPLHSVIR
ncbi:hypothetical protein [Pseudomonas chlororaphis]|uniref:hypothetical protein n=1 Tax=Pseudomonas chlororaphis TaxID=587753 RepID=UPI0031F4C0A3